MLTKDILSGFHSNRELAEHYGRAVIVGMFNGLEEDRIFALARMAGSYARLAWLEDQHLQLCGWTTTKLREAFNTEVQ